MGKKEGDKYRSLEDTGQGSITWFKWLLVARNVCFLLLSVTVDWSISNELLGYMHVYMHFTLVSVACGYKQCDSAVCDCVSNCFNSTWSLIPGN